MTPDIDFYSTFRVKLIPKRVKTTHVRSKNNPISELFYLQTGSKKNSFDPKFGVKLGVKVIKLIVHMIRKPNPLFYYSFKIIPSLKT